MDILMGVAVELRCSNCGGTYQITLRQILLSQHALHEGCVARSETECYPQAYASLIDPELIEELQRAWQRVEEGARAAAGKLCLQVQ